MKYRYDNTFNSIISTEGSTKEYEEYLKELAVKYPWFTMGKMALVKSYLDSDSYADVIKLKSEVSLCLLDYNYFNVINERVYNIPMRLKKVHAPSVIDTFLNTPYKRKEPPVFIDDYINEDLSQEASEKIELVTEDLARIFVKQQLFGDAIDIYSKLILINPEKNVYFVACINELLKRINERRDY